MDTITAVGGLFSSKGTVLKDRLTVLSELAGVEDG